MKQIGQSDDPRTKMLSYQDLRGEQNEEDEDRELTDQQQPNQEGQL